MKKILIADDSIIFRSGLSNILKSLEHEIILACNGKEAVDLALQESPDLIILDLLMPVLTGQEALEIIKQRSPETPVIILSADIQETTKELCKSLGANEFLNKPPNRELFINAIRKYLG